MQKIPLITQLNSTSEKDFEYRRPPMVPVVRNVQSNTVFNSVLANNVIAKAQTKKQQQQYGKSHPLAKLRHSNPVYNTM